jgi:hypothetical protein
MSCEDFFQHLNLSTALGAQKMINPDTGKIIEIGGQEFNSLVSKYSGGRSPSRNESDTSDFARLSGVNETYEQQEQQKPKINSRFKKAQKEDAVRNLNRIVAVPFEQEYNPETAPLAANQLKKAFHANWSVNPRTGRIIGIKSATFRQLVKEFGMPPGLQSSF